MTISIAVLILQTAIIMLLVTSIGLLFRRVYKLEADVQHMARLGLAQEERLQDVEKRSKRAYLARAVTSPYLARAVTSQRL